jgi:hypothetical protein
LSSIDTGTLVVGAGLAGLAGAAELARSGPVTVIERLPAPGGQAGFESEMTQQLYAECARRGVRFLLGSTALRWSAGRLMVVGPAKTEWLSADWLVFAGGSRPGTAAEQGLLGGRLAGVFSAIVAHHLLEAGITLGRRPVVVGGGDWAEIVVPELRHAAEWITLVGSTGTPGEPGVRRWPGYSVPRPTDAPCAAPASAPHPGAVPAEVRDGVLGGDRDRGRGAFAGASGSAAGCDCPTPPSSADAVAGGNRALSGTVENGRIWRLSPAKRVQTR